MLPFGDQEAGFSASIRAEFRKKGTPIGPYNLLIAGTTLAHQGILVTNNTKDFNHVSELKKENWYE